MNWCGRVAKAQSWDELDAILSEADAAYRAGSLTLEQVEILCGRAVERARKVGAKVPTVQRERMVEWQTYEEAA